MKSIPPIIIGVVTATITITSTVSFSLHPTSSFAHVRDVHHRSVSPRNSNRYNQNTNLQSATTDQPSIGLVKEIFNFEAPTTNGTSDVDKFERIDDAIMGGISTSSVRNVGPGKDYASWSGICRTDGGGFCGMRTLPFETPLQIIGYDGVYLKCRLASDNEPDRRVWKMTLRTDKSRGEIVYQSDFKLAKKEIDDKEWQLVKLPYSSFRQVRGPRMIVDAPPLNLTQGVFQFGMTMSKFVMGVNTTQLDNFRDGYFDLHIKSLGVYKDEDTVVPLGSISSPSTLTKEEMMKKRPVVMKVAIAVSKLFFSEKANRRKSALRILKDRGMTRLQAILLGIKIRANGYGLVTSITQSIGIVSIDVARIVLNNVLKVCLFYPFVALSRAVKFAKKNIFGMDVKELPKMA